MSQNFQVPSLDKVTILLKESMSVQYMQCTVAEEKNCTSEIINKGIVASILHHLLPARVSTKGEWEHRCTVSLELHRTRNLNQRMNKQTNKFLYSYTLATTTLCFQFQMSRTAPQKKGCGDTAQVLGEATNDIAAVIRKTGRTLLNTKGFILYHQPICNLTLTITRLHPNQEFLSEWIGCTKLVKPVSEVWVSHASTCWNSPVLEYSTSHNLTSGVNPVRTRRSRVTGKRA